MMSLAGEWFLVELVLGGATRHVADNYNGNQINWEIVNESVLLAGLAAGCSMMEKSGLKGKNEHVNVLFDIRNALIHNSGDIAKNSKQTALNEAKAYLADHKHTSLSANLSSEFFSLKGSQVALHGNVLYAIRLCLV
jgi:hypothetical protein